jgi:hypothetical protein
MKTILYVGATLMIGASIYGFVDYKKTSRNKEFTKMYDSKETSKPVITNPKLNEVVMKKETKSNENTAVVNSKTEEKVTTDPILKDNSAASTDKPVKHQKRFSTRLFSRAPLEEKYISKELKTEPEKTLQKTSPEKNKEQ